MSARYLPLLVGALLLLRPANADAGCALVWGNAEVSQSDAYAHVTIEFMPGGSGPYSCNYYGEVGPPSTPQVPALRGRTVQATACTCASNGRHGRPPP